MKKEAGVGGQDQPLVGQYWWVHVLPVGGKERPRQMWTCRDLHREGWGAETSQQTGHAQPEEDQQHFQG